MFLQATLPLLGALIASPTGKAGAETPMNGVVIERDSQPVFIIAEGKAGARILLDQTIAPGLKEVAMTELVMLPGTSVPEHVHDHSAELLYILEGSGTMIMAGKTIRVKPGMAIYVPAGVKHSFKMDSKVEPLRALQIYTPGGPEQRFKSGAAVKE